MTVESDRCYREFDLSLCRALSKASLAWGRGLFSRAVSDTTPHLRVGILHRQICGHSKFSYGPHYAPKSLELPCEPLSLCPAGVEHTGHVVRYFVIRSLDN